MSSSEIPVCDADGLLNLACHDNPQTACRQSATNGHLECLRYAHEQGSPWDEETCRLASQNGHLECLRYAHENGAPWDERTCCEASYYGMYECLRYAHEHGCPWDENTCTYACYCYDASECLEYAHTHGCPWSETTIVWALEWGAVECLRYAVDHGCPRPDFTTFRLSPSIVPFLYHRGIPLFPGNRDDIRDHIRRHVRQARHLLRCATILLIAYRRACERVYSPDGVGYREAELSFREIALQDRRGCSLEDDDGPRGPVPSPEPKS